MLINTGVHFGQYLPFHYIATLILVLNVGDLQLCKSDRHIIKTNL